MLLRDRMLCCFFFSRAPSSSLLALSPFPISLGSQRREAETQDPTDTKQPADTQQPPECVRSRARKSEKGREASTDSKTSDLLRRRCFFSIFCYRAFSSTGKLMVLVLFLSVVVVSLLL